LRKQTREAESASHGKAVLNPTTPSRDEARRVRKGAVRARVRSAERGPVARGEGRPVPRPRVGGKRGADRAGPKDAAGVCSTNEAERDVRRAAKAHLRTL